MPEQAKKAKEENKSGAGEEKPAAEPSRAPPEQDGTPDVQAQPNSGTEQPPAHSQEQRKPFDKSQPYADGTAQAPDSEGGKEQDPAAEPAAEGPFAAGPSEGTDPPGGGPCERADTPSDCGPEPSPEGPSPLSCGAAREAAGPSCPPPGEEEPCVWVPQRDSPARCVPPSDDGPPSEPAGPPSYEVPCEEANCGLEGIPDGHECSTFESTFKGDVRGCWDPEHQITGPEYCSYNAHRWGYSSDKCLTTYEPTDFSHCRYVTLFDENGEKIGSYPARDCGVGQIVTKCGRDHCGVPDVPPKFSCIRSENIFSDPEEDPGYDRGTIDCRYPSKTVSDIPKDVRYCGYSFTLEGDLLYSDTCDTSDADGKGGAEKGKQDSRDAVRALKALRGGGNLSGEEGAGLQEVGSTQTGGTASDEGVVLGSQRQGEQSSLTPAPGWIGEALGRLSNVLAPVLAQAVTFAADEQEGSEASTERPGALSVPAGPSRTSDPERASILQQAEAQDRTERLGAPRVPVGTSAPGHASTLQERGALAGGPAAEKVGKQVVLANRRSATGGPAHGGVPVDSRGPDAGVRGSQGIEEQAGGSSAWWILGAAAASLTIGSSGIATRLGIFGLSRRRQL